MQLDKAIVIVTGGASGLGEATARRLAAGGAKVVIADLNEAAGTAVADSIGGAFTRCNVAESADAEAAVALATERFGGLTGLVNCAGIGAPERTVGRNGPQPLAHFSKIIQVNLIGSFNMIRIAAAAMMQGDANANGERGVIINTASVAAFDGQIGQAAYSASKGGVVGMTLPIAREFAKFGIRVMTIAPGLFKTPMMAELPEEAQASLGQQVPFPPRLGEPDEYAHMAQHIFENTMLNGETIRLDGAIRMAAK
ncbi:MAG: SDR family NAD(P)-dependent oxidoreductase [Oceanococcaceae bacterium]